MWHKNNFLFGQLVTLAFSIYHLMSWTILPQYQKFRDLIDTFKMSKNKLTYDRKNNDQIQNLPFFLFLDTFLSTSLGLVYKLKFLSLSRFVSCAI